MKDVRREAAANALREYAKTIEGGPRLSRADEVADMRDVADRIERGGSA